MSITLLRHAGKVMIQPRHIIGILLVLAVVGLSFSSCHLSNKVEKVERAYLQQSGNASAYEEHSRGIRAVTQERIHAQDEATTVLEAHPEWSSAPLPDDVGNLLRHDSGTSRAIP